MPEACVVSAFRDVAGFVPEYRKMVSAMRPAPASTVILENGSSDETFSRLEAWPGIHLTSFFTSDPLLPRAATAERSARLAFIRNLAIESALRLPWTHALMLDAQKWIPPDGLGALLAADKDVVAPTIRYRYATGGFYDTWCFRHLDGTPFRPWDPAGGPLREVAAVGGVYLVRREVFEAGCRLAGTDGSGCDSVPFCSQARAAGFHVWMDPSVVSVSCVRPVEMNELNCGAGVFA